MLRKLTLGAVLAASTILAVGPAFADWDRDRRHWRDNHWRGYNDRDRGPYVYTSPNRYYDAPPPVVYAPAPVYPGFSLNFGF